VGPLLVESTVICSSVCEVSAQVETASSWLPMLGQSTLSLTLLSLSRPQSLIYGGQCAFRFRYRVICG